MEAQRYLHSSSATSSRATSRKPPGSVTLSRRDGKRAMNSSAASSAAVPGHSAGLPPSPYAMYAPPSPYLEDLTKSLVTSQPARRKLHLVQQRRYPPHVSPYETLGTMSRVSGRAQLRAQMQTELAARHLQRLWDREAASAAERCGVDLATYATLLELQHRDITPEDYDLLQELDSKTKKRVFSQAMIDERFPAWPVPSEGPILPPANPENAYASRARNLLGDLSGGGGEDEDGTQPLLQCGECAGGNGNGNNSFALEYGTSPSTVPLQSDDEDGGGSPSSPGPSGYGGASSSSQDGIVGGGDGEEAAEEGDEEPRCSICLDPFLPGQFLRSLPCKHFFHVNCIDEWLTTSSRCCPEDGLQVLPELEEADTEDENGAEDDGSGGGNLAHRLGLRYAGGDDEEEQQAAYDPLSLQFERLVYGDPYGAVGQ